jgi:hypothetical protein
VLTLTLPKAEASKPRQIKIGGQGATRAVQENRKS